MRQQFQLKTKEKYINRIQQKVHAENTKPKESYKFNPLDSLFKGDPIEKAKDICVEERSEKIQNRKNKKKPTLKSSKLKKKQNPKINSNTKKKGNKTKK